MLATLIIGLREGLEAALIVGIIAAFLRRNGRGLAAMWLGVGLAIMLSLVIGIALALLEKSLPQAEQEALETIIGAIAVIFVTGMIAWMSTHARHLKRELEAGAAAALSRTGSVALASMAFLAVLREGFETSVFLLATFSVAQSALLAAVGAVLGLAVSVVIGWGIYKGGVKLNLSRFFRATGGFLILVAAGLVLSSLRTAHEAGWLNAGQQPTVDLSWLVAPGTVRSALITGMLGIPADPRLIELLGWLAYLIPVSLFVYWPQAHRPGPHAARRLKHGLAIALVLVAVALPLFYPVPKPHLPAALPVVATGDVGTPLGSLRPVVAARGALELSLALGAAAPQRLSLRAAQRRTETHDGLDAASWTLRETTVLADAAQNVTLEEVMKLAGGRVPPGLNPAQYTGPYAARWAVTRTIDVWTAEGALVDARARNVTTLTLSGSGLPAPRTLRVDGAPGIASDTGWQVAPASVEASIAAIHSWMMARAERAFWTRTLPLALLAAALVIAGLAERAWRRAGRVAQSDYPLPPKTGCRSAADPRSKGAPNAAS